MMWSVKYGFLIPIPQSSIPLFLHSVYSSKFCRQHFHCLSVCLFFIYLLNFKHTLFAQVICRYQVRLWRASKVFTLFIYKQPHHHPWLRLKYRVNAKTWVRYNITVGSSPHRSHHTTSSSLCVLLHGLHKSLLQSFCLLATRALVVM